ncbi:ATP-binding cassette domain-containing protein [Halobacteria archaeon AArc-m2/3/4]|uniref:Cobalamin import ATP-binding protein BtuD n=1 Tax=Natronoglomus mannanivorans TaxID=2979990 RepID=A0AAP2YVW2_9EURY|nr:ATP-binding cassette domain-containing protein [Halobacteria archaeon AArc-xg1-1]MCU4971393.1 ATP-binding cassette domain-containing protein [Halobacteria archaeon AArc-m2/3/4]
MIDVLDLSVAFGDVSVLEDVSLSVEAGTFVGLVGPNGAGKTTLLRAISGALEPDTGLVAIDGTDVHALSSRESSRLVSVVPQDTSLSFSFAVRDVVEMGRTPYRSRFSPPTVEDRERVADALERTGVERFADRSIEDVSGGERQRVILARTIAQDTPVVLLDEPTASLDINHQVETLELVSELVADGKTVIAAIHDLDLAARYCDELVMVADRRVLERGPPESVLTSARLARAFDATAAVTTNPVTGSPVVTALSGNARGGSKPGGDDANVNENAPARVHVVGSGSTAAGVLARLEAADIDASIGPVAETDVAAETARQLGIDRLSVEPFASLEAETMAALQREISRSDVTVIADLRIGAGNQLVLEALADAEPLLVVESTPFDDRNAAGEGARDRYERLRSRGVRADPETVVERVLDVCDEYSDVDSTAPDQHRPIESDDD